MKTSCRLFFGLIKIWETTTIQNLILFWNSQAESISLVNMMLWSWKLKSLERTELVDLKEYYVMYGILGYPWVSSQMEIYLIKTIRLNFKLRAEIQQLKMRQIPFQGSLWKYSEIIKKFQLEGDKLNKAFDWKSHLDEWQKRYVQMNRRHSQFPTFDSAKTAKTFSK